MCSSDLLRASEIAHQLVISLYQQGLLSDAMGEIVRIIPHLSPGPDAACIHQLAGDINFALGEYVEASHSYWTSWEIVQQFDPDFFIEFEPSNFESELTSYYITEDFVRAEKVVKMLPFHDDDKADLLWRIAEPHGAHERHDSYISFDTYERIVSESIRLCPMYQNLYMLAHHYWALFYHFEIGRAHV